MIRRLNLNLCPAGALILFAGAFCASVANAAPPDTAGDVEGVVVLTRGPVHEAFAEIIAFDLQPGVVITTSPPDTIRELPPAQKPAGENVAWIPGYWSWDDEQDDFLWVSGVWRSLPPGRQWVPGYWGKTDQGTQWISGYWADSGIEEIEYLSQPPEMANVEPVGDAPDANQIWVPAIPVWSENRYVVRPGYWTTVQNDWTWMPAHYVWSPRGYVFIDGYWDYSINRRGMLFAPVRFGTDVYSQRGFVYSPVNVINPVALLGNLFLRPNYGHYYFGDYYAPSYAQAGFYPSYAYHNHQGYDPFYAQQRWQNRQDSDWEQNVKTQFQTRRDDEQARPPRTLTAQNERVKAGSAADKVAVMSAPLQTLAKDSENPQKLEDVTDADRTKFGLNEKGIQSHRAARAKLESTPSTPGAKDTAERSGSARMRLPASPFVASKDAKLGEEHMPPKIPETPKLDPRAEIRKRGSTPATADKPKPRSNPAADPKGTPSDAPKPGAERKPVRKIEPADGTRPGSKPEVKPVPKPDAKPVPMPKTEVDRKRVPGTAPKPGPGAEPRPSPKPEAKGDPRPKTELKSSPRSEPKTEPKPAPRAEPKPESKSAPKSEPKKGAKEEPKQKPR